MVAGAKLFFRLGFKLLRWTWKFLLWGGALWFVLYIAVLFYKKPLATKLLKDIFRTDVSIGRITIDLVDDYPMSRVTVYDLVVHGTNPKVPSEVITIKKASVWLTIPDLVARPETKHIPRIIADGVQVALVIDKNGNKNFDLFKPKQRKKPKIPPKLVNLPKIELKNVGFKYISYLANRHYQYQFRQLAAGIHIFPDSMAFEVQGDGQSELMNMGNFNILIRTPLQLNADFVVTKADKRLRFKTAKVNLAGTDIHFVGSLLTGAERRYDLRFSAPHGNIETLLSLVPRKAGKEIKIFETVGEMALDGLLKGQDTETDNPLFYLGFKCAETTIKNKKTNTAITGITLRGAYTNGPSHSIATTELRVDTLTARLGARPIHGSLRLTNFKQLHLDANLDANLFAPDVAAFAGLALAPGGNGDIEINCNIHGDFYKLADPNSLDSLNYKGEIIFRNVRLQPNKTGFLLENFNGAIRLVQRDLVADNLAGIINGQFFRFDAKIERFIPYLTKKYPTLHLEAEMDAPTFNVLEFLDIQKQLIAQAPKTLAQDSLAQTKKTTEPPKKSIYDLPAGLNFNFTLNFGQLRYHNLIFQEVRIPIVYDAKRLKIDTLKLENSSAKLLFAFLLDGRDKQFVLMNSLFRFDIKDVSKLTQSIKPPNQVAPTPNNLMAIKGVFRAYGSLQKKQITQTDLPAGSARLFFNLDSTEVHQQKLLSENQPTPNAKNKKGGLHIKGLGFRARLAHLNIENPTASRLEVDSIFGIANDKYYLKANLNISDWKTKQTEINIDSYLSIPIFLEYFNVNNIEQPSGSLKLKLNIQGPLTHFSKPDSFLNLPFRGSLEFEQMGFVLASNHQEVKNLNARLSYDEKQGVKIERMTGKLGHTDFKLRGTLRDALPYLYLKNKTVYADIHLDSDTIDIGTLLTRNKKRPEAGYHFELPGNIDLQADAKVQYATFDSLKLKNIRLNTILRNKTLLLKELHLNTCDGSLTLEGSIDNYTNPDSIQFKANMLLRSVNVKEVLRSLNNLGQAFLTDDVIEGNLTADINLSDRMPLSLKSDMRNLNGSLYFKIHNGCFTDFKPFAKLNLLMRKSRLQKVYFTMQGTELNFKNRTLYINEIDFKSSIVNLLIQGVHRFDQKLIYKLIVLPSPPSDKVVVFPPILSFLSKSYTNSVLAFTLRGSDKKFHVAYDGKRAFKNFLTNFGIEDLSPTQAETSVPDSDLK